jgi:hypothetical protein
MSYTANRWTTEEIEKAVGLYKKGKDYKYISGKIDGRSPFAIQCKLETYVLDKINNGSTYKSLAKDLNKAEEDLKTMYESQFKRNATKNGSPVASSNSSNLSNNSNLNNNFIAAPNTAFSLINRIMTPFIEYNENLLKLEKLKESGMISGKIYKEIKRILDENPIDPEKFISQLKSTVETKRICPVKSDSKTEESDNSDDDDNNNDNEKDNKDNKEKNKKGKENEEAMEPEVKLPRKRLF